MYIYILSIHVDNIFSRISVGDGTKEVREGGRDGMIRDGGIGYYCGWGFTDQRQLLEVVVGGWAV
jgi:hypothetical protein